jgi:hypothetical protein
VSLRSTASRVHRQNHRETNALLAPAYWHLLSDVITSSASCYSANARPTSSAAKTWLHFIVGRLPLNHLIAAYLLLLAQADAGVRSELDAPFQKCFHAIWPILAPRLTADVMLDCFGSLLSSLKAAVEEAPGLALLEGLASVATTVTAAYRTSLANVTNKRKVCI